jgi:hypothetical protein
MLLTVLCNFNTVSLFQVFHISSVLLTVFFNFNIYVLVQQQRPVVVTAAGAFSADTAALRLVSSLSVVSVLHEPASQLSQECIKRRLQACGLKQGGLERRGEERRAAAAVWRL